MRAPLPRDVWDVLFAIEQAHADTPLSTQTLGPISATDSRENLVNAATVIVGWLTQQDEASRSAAVENGLRSDLPQT